MHRCHRTFFAILSLLPLASACVAFSSLDEAPPSAQTTNNGANNDGTNNGANNGANNDGQNNGTANNGTANNGGKEGDCDALCTLLQDCGALNYPGHLENPAPLAGIGPQDCEDACEQGLLDPTCAEGAEALSTRECNELLECIGYQRCRDFCDDLATCPTGILPDFTAEQCTLGCEFNPTSPIRIDCDPIDPTVTGFDCAKMISCGRTALCHDMCRTATSCGFLPQSPEAFERCLEGCAAPPGALTATYDCLIQELRSDDECPSAGTCFNVDSTDKATVCDVACDNFTDLCAGGRVVCTGACTALATTRDAFCVAHAGTKDEVQRCTNDTVLGNCL